MRHLDEGTIHAWLDGALSEEKAHQAEEHAARCTQCAMAVADARGFIAGASRILLALDDVPKGVIPGERPGSALGARRSATATTPTRIYQPWMLKVAASIVVVAGTALLITRTRERVPEMARFAESKTDSFSPANGAAAAPAAVNTPDMAPAAAATGGAQGFAQSNAAAPIADQKVDALLKSKSAAEPSAERRAPSTALAADSPAAPARQFAAAPAESARLDSTSGAPARNHLASVAPKIEVFQSSASPAAAGAAKRAIGGQDAAMSPGMRMVSEQTVTAQARVVQKRVYEVSPGVQVTYSIFEPVPARSKAAENDAAASDSGAAAKDENADSEAGVNTIKWSDSTGTDFVLSGRLPLDSLRVIRGKLPTVRKE